MGKGKRPLGIPNIKDRVVQIAVKLVIEPVLEEGYLDCSYWFRLKNIAHQAMDGGRKDTNRHDWWVLDIGIKGYFNSITMKS